MLVFKVSQDSRKSLGKTPSFDTCLTVSPHAFRSEGKGRSREELRQGRHPPPPCKQARSSLPCSPFPAAPGRRRCLCPGLPQSPAPLCPSGAWSCSFFAPSLRPPSLRAKRGSSYSLGVPYGVARLLGRKAAPEPKHKRRGLTEANSVSPARKVASRPLALPPPPRASPSRVTLVEKLTGARGRESPAISFCQPFFCRFGDPPSEF